MPLSPNNWKEILRGFRAAPFVVEAVPKTIKSPLTISWENAGAKLRFRLWAFEVTHGGKTRAEDEFRVQVSSGPRMVNNESGYKDVLVGYIPDEDAVVIYDSRYLRHFRSEIRKGKSPSPSVQVSRSEIEEGVKKGFHVFQKDTELFGNVPVAVFNPDFLPVFLLSPDELIAQTLTPEEAQNKMPTTAPDLLAYCRGRGFHFPADVVARYVAALSTKPLVILAGTTGTGKTKLAQLAAEYFCRSAAGDTAEGWDSAPQGEDVSVKTGTDTIDRTRFAFVSVRPDWTDNQALLGYFNPILQRYEATPLTLLILRAWAAHDDATAKGQPPPPYFLVLDELNLARVEHYFSDFLSVLETRKRGPNGELEQEPMLLHNVATDLSVKDRAQDGSLHDIKIPRTVSIPPNLYIVGTVNVDETTYGFSPKVLDRSNVIEFDQVDLGLLRTDAPQLGPEGEPQPTIPTIFPAFELINEQHYKELPDEAHQALAILNDILYPARLHFGYRSAGEIAAFIKRYRSLYPGEGSQEVVLNRALDAAILQKVLPRLHGSRARLEDMMLGLHFFLRTGSAPVGTYKKDQEGDLARNPGGNVRYAKARIRLAEMYETLVQFGFVSFFK